MCALRRRAGLLLEHRGGEDDSWCAPYALTGAGRLCPYCCIAVLANVLIATIYWLWMPLAPAAMLNDLANALDAFLSKSPRYLVNWYAARGP